MYGTGEDAGFELSLGERGPRLDRLIAAPTSELRVLPFSPRPTDPSLGSFLGVASRGPRGPRVAHKGQLR